MKFAGSLAALVGLGLLFLIAGCTPGPVEVASDERTFLQPPDSEKIDDAIRQTPGVELTGHSDPQTLKFMFLIPYYTTPEGHFFRYRPPSWDRWRELWGQVEHHPGSAKVKVHVNHYRWPKPTGPEKQEAKELIEHILDNLRREVAR